MSMDARGRRGKSVDTTRGTRRGSFGAAETSVNPAGPDPSSATVTCVETGTSLLFGGQRTFGVAEHATVGGVVSPMPSTVQERRSKSASRPPVPAVKPAYTLVPTV